MPSDVSDEEVSSRSDPTSIIVPPWQKDTAWVASDLWCEGKFVEPYSRNILKRVVAQAADVFETDDLGRKVMGELMAKTYADFKRAEQDEYLTHVRDWEVSRYLKLW